jgi:hypothetical protein
MSGTAIANVVTGQISVANGDTTTIEPWGAEEYGMGRATAAIEELGYSLIGQWIQSDAPVEEWTASVEPA